jgi:hypothetical protein
MSFPSPISKLYRSYTLDKDIDETNINNGRCPNYALDWKEQSNNPHWPLGHDYYLGNGLNIDADTKEERIRLSKAKKEKDKK